MLSSNFQILLMIVSLAGVWLNIQKRREGFLIWSFTNALWAYIDFKAGLMAQGTLFLVYLILSILGWFKWDKEDDDIKLINGDTFRIVRFMGSHWAIQRKEMLSWNFVRHHDYCSCLSVSEDEIISFKSKEAAKEWLVTAVILQ